MRPAVDSDTRPLVLIWEVTQACDLACDHCRAAAKPGRHPEELTTAEGKRLLESAREFGDGQLVVLSGGDPLKRDDLAELVEYGTDLGLHVALTPSGTSSLSRDRLAALKTAGLRRIALSLDGATAESHDRFRGESGSFEETFEAARDAEDLGIPVQINTTVCAETIEELPEIRSLIRDLAVLWSVFFLVPIGRGRLLQQITPERAEECMRWLSAVSESEPFGVKTTEAPQYRRVRAEEGTETPGNRRGIVAGDGFAFVSHRGEVYPSGFLPKAAGNVRERSVVDTYRNAPLFEQLRDRDSLEGACGVCPYRELCGGSRSRAYATTGNPLAADPLCPYEPPGFEADSSTAEGSR
ncbi:MAG: radical SAM protein [Natronomonas sp.]